MLFVFLLQNGHMATARGCAWKTGPIGPPRNAGGPSQDDGEKIEEADIWTRQVPGWDKCAYLGPFARCSSWRTGPIGEKDEDIRLGRLLDMVVQRGILRRRATCPDEVLPATNLLPRDSLILGREWRTGPVVGTSVGSVGIPQKLAGREKLRTEWRTGPVGKHDIRPVRMENWTWALSGQGEWRTGPVTGWPDLGFEEQHTRSKSDSVWDHGAVFFDHTVNWAPFPQQRSFHDLRACKLVATRAPAYVLGKGDGARLLASLIHSQIQRKGSKIRIPNGNRGGAGRSSDSDDDAANEEGARAAGDWAQRAYPNAGLGSGERDYLGGTGPLLVQDGPRKEDIKGDPWPEDDAMEKRKSQGLESFEETSGRQRPLQVRRSR